MPIARMFSRGGSVAWSRSRGPREQCSQANQVVGGRGKGDVPIDEVAAAMPQLPQPADGLHPAEDMIDQLTSLLTDRIARVTACTILDRTLLHLPRDVRGDAACAHRRDKARDVVALVATD